jgi:4'-phosphopantetheinyl transferase EntD
MAMSPEPDKYDAPGRIAAWVTATAPGGIAVAVDRIGSSTAFDAVEEAVIARAVARRRDEFITGRRLARKALADLGCVAAGLPPDSDGVPQWPEGFIGTISHSGGLCVAVVGRTCDLVGIGIDIEEIVRMQPGIAPLISRPDEAEIGNTSGGVDLTLLRFVAKEALFKAYFPATRGFLDFLDVRVSLNLENNRFEAQLMELSKSSLCGSRTFVGHFTTVESHVVAGVWIAR